MYARKYCQTGGYLAALSENRKSEHAKANLPASAWGNADGIRMKLPESALNKSVLVVAHPDDEVLWFSSILNEIDKIIIVFLDAGHSPELGKSRQRGIDEHEFRDRITLLNLAQTRSHNRSAWPEPEETEFGLRLTSDPEHECLYQDQGLRVRAALDTHIQGASNVFTHNPWGEYGHEDHVQIHRITTQLARSTNSTVWYGSYVSNKSSMLMQSYMQVFDNSYYTMPVDRDRAKQIADTYFRNNAWTWPDDYAWFPSESFIQGPLERQQQPCAGAFFPVNYLRVPFDPETANAPPPGPITRIRRKLRRLLIANKKHPTDAATD